MQVTDRVQWNYQLNPFSPWIQIWLSAKMAVTQALNCILDVPFGKQSFVARCATQMNFQF